MKIQAIGNELTPAERHKLSRGLRRLMAELFPGKAITVEVRYLPDAKVIPLHRLIRQGAEEKRAAKQVVPRDVSLYVLGLSKVVVLRLEAVGIINVGLLEQKTEKELLDVPSIGRKQLNQIIRVLAAHNRKLAG